MLRYLSTGIAICGLVCSASWAQESETNAPSAARIDKGSAKADERPGKQLLRWKFAKGDVLRYEYQIVETVVIDDKSRFRNERNYLVRWTVRDVDADGIAKVWVSFERVRFKLEIPELVFDSDTDNAGREPSRAHAREQYYSARALAQSEFSCSATDRGGTSSIAGGEAVQLTAIPIMFTPGDWPALPQSAVTQGDSWTAPASVADPMGSMSGETTHVLRGSKTLDGRSALEIECTTEWTKLSGAMYEGAKVSPTSVVAYFDPLTGRFLSRRVQSGVAGRTGEKERFTLTVETTSRLLPANPPSAWQPRTPVVGIQFAEDQELTIVPHSDWIDDNKNGIPEPDELQGVKTQFSEDEKYCLALFVRGLKGRKLHYDLVNARGATLKSDEVPLKGDGVVAIRQIVDDTGIRSGLIPGMYFLQWSLEDKFFHFTPVHIVRGERAEASALSQELVNPTSAQEFIQRGRIRQHQRELTGAWADFTEAIRLEPQNDAAYMLRAGVYFLMRNYPRARADCDESIRLNANNPAAFAMRAMIRMRSDDLKAAYDDATEVIRLAPKLADAYLARGEILGRMRKYDEALVDFDAAIGLDPGNPESFRNRGKTWLAKLEFDKCIVDVTEAIRLNPNDAEAYYRRGQARQFKGEMEQAVHDFDQAIAHNSQEPAFYLTRGMLLAQQGVHDRALADLDAVLRLDPKNLQAYHLRGDLRATQGDFDQSIADHGEVIQRNPADVDAWVQRGVAYISKRDLDKGIDDLTEALRLQPGHYVALCIRGDAWISKGQHQKSIDDHTAAIAANPKLASAYHHRGATLSTIGKYAEAIVDFEEAIRLDPKVPWPHFAYSLILSASPEAKFRDGQRAVELAKTAGNLLEWKRPEVWMALAAAQAETGAFDAAVQAQTKALELKPGDQDLQTQLELYRQQKPFRETPRPDIPNARRVRF